MHEDLVTRLKAVTSITTLTGTRIGWFERPRVGSLPALELTAVAPGQEWRLADLDALERPRVQFDCWGATKTSAKSLRDAVLAEMQRTDNVTTGSTTFLPPADLEGEFTTIDDLTGTDGVFRWMLDFSFFHQPA